MYNKKLIIFLLAVLILIVSIGVVSADGNSTSMELSSDESATEIAQSPDIDIIRDDSATENDTKISDYGYEVDMPKYTDNDEIYTIRVSEMPKDATGNITISIDGDEKYCQPVSIAMNVVIINELNLDWGMHNASVKYTGDDKYKGFVENGQFEHNYFHFKVSDEITDDSIDWDAMSGVTGSIKILIDGKTFYNHKIAEHKSINLNKLKYGVHTYEFRYSGNYPSINKKGKFHYTYPFYIYDLKDEYNIKLGDEITFFIDLPEDAKSKLNIQINNRTYSTQDSEITLTDFDIGENNITISYKDSKYPKRTFKTKAMVLPSLTIPATVNYEGNDTLSLLLSESAKGTLTVEVDSIPWKTVEVKNGKAEIILNNLTIKNHILSVSYTGDFEKYIPQANYTINVIPYLSIPKKMWKYGENYIIFNASKDFNGDLILKGIVNDTITIQNGSAKVLLSNLTEGQQTLMAYYENYTWKLDAIIYNESPDWKMTIVYPDQVHVNSELYTAMPQYDVHLLNLPINLTGNFSLYHDGKFCGTYKISKNNPTLQNLAPKLKKIGNHTIQVIYSGDDYFNRVNATHVYEVSNFVCLISDYSLIVELPQDATGTITVKINGKKFDSQKAIKEEDIYKRPALYQFTLENIEVNDVVEVIYNGNYGKLTKKVIKKEDYVPDNPSESKILIHAKYLNDDSEVTYLSKNEIMFEIGFEEDAFGVLTIEILNKETGKYEFFKNASVNNGVAVVTFPSSKVGEYKYKAHFDGNYEAEDLEESITITPTFKFPSSMKYGEEQNVTVTLDNQTQVKVILYVDLGLPLAEYNINATSNVMTINKELIDKVTSVIKYNARHDQYWLEIEGDFYLNTKYIYSGFLIKVKFTPKLASKNVVMNYLDEKTFTVKATDIFGKLAGAGEIIKIKIGKTTYNAKTNKNGVATIKLKQTPGKYTIKTTFQGMTVKNTLIVKQVLTLKKVAVKKSAKKLVLQATLKKAKTPLKNKIVKFKFNGKTYKTKTNAKGIAKVTIKSSVLKKLKIGKKLTYQATYVKDTVKKTVKVQK